MNLLILINLFSTINICGKWTNSSCKTWLLNYFPFFIVARSNALSLSNDDKTALIDKEPTKMFKLNQYKFCKMVVTLVRGQIDENTTKVRVISTLFWYRFSLSFIILLRSLVIRSKERKFLRKNAYHWPIWKSFDQFVVDWLLTQSTIL